MQITKANYFKEAARLDWASLPEEIRKGHELVSKATNNGANWSLAAASSTISDLIEAHLDVVDRLARGELDLGKDSPTIKPKSSERARSSAPSKKEPGRKAASPKKKSPQREKPKPAALPTHLPEMGPELKLIRRFVNLHGKPKTRKVVLGTYNAVNRAVARGEVRRTAPATPYWEHVAWIQEKLYSALDIAYLTDDPDEVRTIQFDEDRVEGLKKLVKKFRVWPSVSLALRFASMQGKRPPMEKVDSLADAIDKAEKAGKLKAKADKVAVFIPKIKSALSRYKAGLEPAVSLQNQPLNGLGEALSGCGCRGGSRPGKSEGAAEKPFAPLQEHLPTGALLGAVTPEPKGTAKPVSGFQGKEPRLGFVIPPRRGTGKRFRSDQMPSNPSRSLKFEGKWAELFNQPAKGFSAMVWGLPKSGKSSLAIDFGSYLAKNFGTVFYAAIEEGDDETIRQRIERLKAGHHNMEVFDHLPADLSGWEFVIVDSASEGLMDASTMQELIDLWPDTSFIFLFHSTNQGLPRGGTIYRHIVDVLVEVKEGNAKALGRFGLGQMPVRTA